MAIGTCTYTSVRMRASPSTKDRARFNIGVSSVAIPRPRTSPNLEQRPALIQETWFAKASPELAATARAAVAPASAEKTRPAERGTGCQLSKTDTKGDNDHSAPGGEGAPKETPEGHSGSWWRGGGWAPQSTATRPREPAQNAQEDQRSKGDSSGGSWWRGGWNAAWSNTSRSSAEWGQAWAGGAPRGQMRAIAFSGAPRAARGEKRRARPVPPRGLLGGDRG
eukprot:1579386-Pyramimonas_sp.AAC.1